jgi:hypothetical protein
MKVRPRARSWRSGSNRGEVRGDGVDKGEVGRRGGGGFVLVAGM